MMCNIMVQTPHGVRYKCYISSNADMTVTYSVYRVYRNTSKWYLYTHVVVTAGDQRIYVFHIQGEDEVRTPPWCVIPGSYISSYYKHDISSAKRVEAVALVGAVLYLHIVIATPQVSLTSCYRYYRHYNSCALPTTIVTTQLLLP